MHIQGKGTQVSIRYNEKTGQFDEPGYGDQGQYGDVVKALNAVKVPALKPLPTPEETVRDITSTSPVDVAKQNKARDDAAFAASMARIDDRMRILDAQLKTQRERVTAAEIINRSNAQRTAFTKQDIADMEAKAAALETGTPGSRERQAAMDRVRMQQSPGYRPPQPREPSVPPSSAWRGGPGVGVGPGLMEHYYNILSERLEQLDEASREQRAEARAKSMGFNLGSDHPRSRGGVNVSAIKPERLGPHLKSIISSGGGERTFSGEAQETTKETPKQPSWGERLKPHIITLMGAAQDHKIELSKEEAVSNSADRRRLLAQYQPGSDVHKAAQAVDEIMKTVKQD